MRRQWKFVIFCYPEYLVDTRNNAEKRLQVFQHGDWEDSGVSRKKKKARERAFQGLGIRLQRYQHKVRD